MTNSQEARFQQDIIDAMVDGGWKAGTASGYDRASALYTEDLLGYVLVESNGTRVFGEDQSFSSPSAAAAVVSGRSANGRISWKAEGSGMTYGEWQDQQVSAAAEAAPE